MRSFSYTPEACLYRGVSLTLLMLFFFFFFFFEDVSFDSSCHFQEGVSDTFLLLVQFNEEFMLCLFVRSFSYIPDATFSEEFLLHISGCVYL